ncbi:MAG: hypothetical protein RLZZ501_92, partial [Pseudomonadota bacterium]
APAEGEGATLTLTFAQAGTIETRVTASSAVPAPPAHQPQHGSH